MRTATSALLACFLAAPPGAGYATTTVGAGQPAPRFRSSVQMVTVAAVVRDAKGRFVRNLSREDVQVFDRGAPRVIREFRADLESPVSIALLFDESGSMSMASRSAAAQQAAAHILAALDPRRDEVAVFAFDSGLREVEPFTQDLQKLKGRLGSGQPFGTTALFDAVGETAERVAARGGRRKAVVVLTDGLDNSSRRRAEEVSAAASAIDVPVYVMAVVSPIDHVGTDTAADTQGADVVGQLGTLARWTGGDVFVASTPAHESVAARRIVAELRHQYLLAFEAGVEPGWHAIEVRVRDRGATVRARSGYAVGS